MNTDKGGDKTDKGGGEKRKRGKTERKEGEEYVLVKRKLVCLTLNRGAKYTEIQRKTVADRGTQCKLNNSKSAYFYLVSVRPAT